MENREIWVPTPSKYPLTDAQLANIIS